MDNQDNKANESSPNKDGTEDHNPKDGAGAKEIPKVEADKPEHYGPIVHSGSHNPSQCGENFFHNAL